LLCAKATRHANAAEEQIAGLSSLTFSTQKKIGILRDEACVSVSGLCRLGFAYAQPILHTA
jgi:hypothetical protein